MSISMYEASVPVFTHMLNNLSAMLDKAQAHAEAKKFDANVYLSLRLFPDMLPFSKQVQIACDAAKLCVTRISGVEAPKFDDTEASLGELKVRIARTIDYLKSVPAEKMNEGEEKEVVLPLRQGEIKFKGRDYLLRFAMPNHYFHITTAYGLLRQAGVELGKMDYLRGPQAA
jgi:hypothetical protein